MPVYYVQNFNYDEPGGNNRDSTCYGEQDAHNHNRSIQFSKDIKAYLTSGGCTNINPGNFLSNQNKPAAGNEFKWSTALKKWVMK